MNQYYELLKQEIIVFEKLIMDKYHLIGLNEIETVILIKLNKSLKQGKRKLVIEDIVPNMTLDKETLSKTVIDLVQRGYISVELSSVDALETFNLDGTMKRLSEVFEDDNPNRFVIDANITKTVQKIEAEMGKVMSSIDFEIVQKWFKDYNYTTKQIDEALGKAAINKKVSVKYIDRILANQSKYSQSVSSSNNDIMELFTKVYGKSR